MIKALVLFSGGLDSQLVIKILQEQKIDIVALHFILPFGEGCCLGESCVFNFCQKNGVKLEFIDCTRGKNFQQYLEIIKNPRFGHGAGLNPCIDCRIFILNKAKQYANQPTYLLPAQTGGRRGSKSGSTRETSYFIATGEVLGERPMSQHLRALKLIEKETGLENKILRPLSAKLLPETEAETKGWVDRGKLYAISGRRRLPQIELAKKYCFKNYPNPAGGCLLCDKEFSKRFKAMLENFGDLNENDIELLKLGRHFWQKKRHEKHELHANNTNNNSNNHFQISRLQLPSEKGYAFGCLIVIGRNQGENQKLEKLARKNDVLVEPENFPGPSALIRGRKITKKEIEKAKNLIKTYSKKTTIRPKFFMKKP